jgi:hypothetical protein
LLFRQKPEDNPQLEE